MENFYDFLLKMDEWPFFRRIEYWVWEIDRDFRNKNKEIFDWCWKNGN